MENGIFVFTPTVAEFNDFANLMTMMQQIAGSESGAVKIVVPQDW